MIKRMFLIALVGLALVAGAYFFLQHVPVGLPAPHSLAVVAPSPPEVRVVRAEPAEVPYPVEYAGLVAEVRDVEVRPRVGGLLLKCEYKKGARVMQGQVLFQIDPAPHKVALRRA